MAIWQGLNDDTMTRRDGIEAHAVGFFDRGHLVMKKVTSRSGIAGIGLALCGMAISSCPSMATAANAYQFMKGGDHCFRIGEATADGWHTTLKMVSRLDGEPLPAYLNLYFGGLDRLAGRIAHIDAIERGYQVSDPSFSYVMPMIGSATIASQVTDEEQLQVHLNGSNFGINLVGGPTGVWITNYAMSLDLTDLSGHATGIKAFTPIQDGQLGIPDSQAIDETISPIGCRDF
jgi:hypothetical protein